MHLLSIIALFLAVAGGVHTANALKATCVLKPSPGSQVTGTIILTQQSRNEQVRIEANVNGLRPGQHGWHVHEYGDLTNGCTSAGQHYNPLNMKHGGPDSQVRHAGDFGNLEADGSGQAHMNIMDPVTQLYGGTTAIGRSIVVHEKVDDLGQGGNLESLQTGNSGGRLACCVIGVAPEGAKV